MRCYFCAKLLKFVTLCCEKALLPYWFSTWMKKAALLEKVHDLKVSVGHPKIPGREPLNTTVHEMDSCPYM